MIETQQYKLKAMARNYAGGHNWDHLDGDTCIKAAVEIDTLRTANQRLGGEVKRLREALKSTNELLRVKRHACENPEVCHVLDAYIKRNRAALSTANGEVTE